MFKNKFKLLLIAPVFIVAGIVGTEQAQADSLSAESLDKSHPCYEHVYKLANEKDVRQMRENEVTNMSDMVLPEELQNQDHQLAYIYVFGKEYDKGRSAKEIRQAILEKCISNKKLS